MDCHRFGVADSTVAVSACRRSDPLNLPHGMQPKILTLYTEIRRQPSVKTKLSLSDDPTVILVTKSDLMLANKIPSLTVAISYVTVVVVVYIFNVLASKNI